MYLLYITYILYTVYMNISEFRKNLRESFNKAETGGDVHIERHGKWFKLVKEPDNFSIDNEGQKITIPFEKKNTRLPNGKITLSSTPVGPNPFSRLATDKVSSNVRPDIGQCPHGYAQGMCKKADCNRKYKK